MRYWPHTRRSHRGVWCSARHTWL